MNFTVEKQFILDAHSAACADWKKKIETQFPDLFPKDITDKIKSWADVLKAANKDERDVLPYRNPKTKQEVSQNAFAKIQLISEVLNQGWVPSFTNPNEYKYYPYFERKSSGWAVCSFDCFNDGIANLGAGGYFKSSKLAEFAGKTFLDIYKEYLPE